MYSRHVPEYTSFLIFVLSQLEISAKMYGNVVAEEQYKPHSGAAMGRPAVFSLNYGSLGVAKKNKLSYIAVLGMAHTVLNSFFMKITFL